MFSQSDNSDLLYIEAIIYLHKGNGRWLVNSCQSLDDILSGLYKKEFRNVHRVLIETPKASISQLQPSHILRK